MTKTNLPQKLREIINLRNLLIISILLIITPVSGAGLWDEDCVSPTVYWDSDGYYLLPYSQTQYYCHDCVAGKEIYLLIGPSTSYTYYYPGDDVFYNDEWIIIPDGGHTPESLSSDSSKWRVYSNSSGTCNYVSSYDDWCEVDGYTEYSVNISATGTFCYSYPLSFNVSLDGYTDEYSFYWLHFYKDGNPVSYYSAFDGNDDGYYSFSKSLPPGDYASQGIIEFEDYELEEWLNFTVTQDCSLAFNGTITDTNPYIYVTNHTWEWSYYDYLDNLTPWDEPTFDHGNGTSYIDVMYSSGYINESEYDFIYQRYMDIINQSNNATAVGNEYIFGILTPFEMINDGIITVRSNINGSVSFLTDGISPITSIFSWILQMMPSWVINLFSIVLAFDATRIILAGRK